MLQYVKLIDTTDQIDRIGDDRNISNNSQKARKNIVGASRDNNRVTRLQQGCDVVDHAVDLLLRGTVEPADESRQSDHRTDPDHNPQHGQKGPELVGPNGIEGHQDSVANF